MSAPVTERGRAAIRGRAAAIPAQRGFADGDGAVEGAVAAPAAPTSEPTTGAGQSARRSAQQKAYARRDERVRRATGARAAKTAAPAGRPQFVLLIMVLLAVGLVATLWLSTAAAADSYRLQDATAEARILSEQAERLKQEVAVLASAPELARRAGGLGMVPVRDPARLVVAADGSIEVVGQPKAAVAPPPPAPPEPAAGAQQPAPGDTEEGTEQDGAPGEDAPDGAEGAPDGADPDGADPDGADPNGSAQLAAGDAERAGAPAVDGDASAGAADGAREGASGEDGAEQDAAGRDAGPGTGARADGGTDAG